MYESSDLFFSEEGDYVIDQAGDMFDTLSDPLLALGQIIRDRCKYVAGSFKLYPRLGVLTLPFGIYNFDENREMYAKQLEIALTEDGIIIPEDLEVDISPIDHESWLITIALRLHPSFFNSDTTERVFFVAMSQRNQEIRFF